MTRTISRRKVIAAAGFLAVAGKLTSRNMVVDAYYTSPVGVKELGYMGNGAMRQFSDPAEAVEYAMKRSQFANGD